MNLVQSCIPFALASRKIGQDSVKKILSIFTVYATINQDLTRIRVKEMTTNMSYIYMMTLLFV